MANSLEIGFALNTRLRRRRPPEFLSIETAKARKHTALLAQSGSGKSFFLGRYLEELATRTRARIIVLDPNSDFLRFTDVSPSVWKAAQLRPWFPPGDTPDRFTKAWRQVGVRVFSNRFVKNGLPLRVHWGDLELEEMLWFLGISETRDPALYWYLRSNRLMCDELWEDSANRAYDFAFFADVAQRLQQRLLGDHAAMPRFGDYALNTALARSVPPETGLRYNALVAKLEAYDIWAAEGEADLRSMLVGADAPQVAVLDLQSLERDRERLLVANQVLGAIWKHGKNEARQRLQDPTRPDLRVPIFVVIDEAHNLVPAERGDDALEVVARDLERIAAEGRKYGLFLIVVTQRPRKISANVLSECDNVCLLKMSNVEDVRATRAVLGSVPEAAEDLLPGFGKGDALLCGGFVPQAVLVHGAPRRTLEGGSDLADDWWSSKV